jgi:hypothetical protein
VAAGAGGDIGKRSFLSGLLPLNLEYRMLNAEFRLEIEIKKMLDLREKREGEDRTNQGNKGCNAL